MNLSIVLAGGTGTRLGESIPKQYLEVGGKMIITYCLETFAKSEDIDGIWIVSEDNWRADIETDLIRNISGFTNEEDVRNVILGYANPGKNRQLSIYNALAGIEQYCLKHEIALTELHVMVHDAARPCLTTQMIASYFKALDNHDGVMPALPMKDTVYISKDGKAISELLKREEIYAGQAPEIFNFVKYKKACEDLMPEKIMTINGSTEPAILAGMDVAIVPGDEGNFKVTTKNDLIKFKELIEK